MNLKVREHAYLRQPLEAILIHSVIYAYVSQVASCFPGISTKNVVCFSHIAGYTFRTSRILPHN
jgi:hypothetical protein